MTVDLAKQLQEDRQMRDQALALVKQDIDHLKSDYQDKGIGERAVDKLKGSANGIYGEAVEVASDHRGVLAALVGAIVLWFARHPILAFLFGDKDADEDADRDDGGLADRTRFNSHRYN